MNTQSKFSYSSSRTNYNKKKLMSNSMSSGNFPLLSTTYSKPLNIKTIKITDMYKNLYNKETGKAIKSIIHHKEIFKIPEEKETIIKK